MTRRASGATRWRRQRPQNQICGGKKEDRLQAAAFEPTGRWNHDGLTVDQDDEIRLRRADERLHLTKGAHDLASHAQRVPHADHRELRRIDLQLHTGGAHAVAADADQVRIRGRGANSACEVAAMQIPGHVPGDKVDRARARRLRRRVQTCHAVGGGRRRRLSTNAVDVVIEIGLPTQEAEASGPAM